MAVTAVVGPSLVGIVFRHTVPPPPPAPRPLRPCLLPSLFILPNFPFLHHSPPFIISSVTLVSVFSSYPELLRFQNLPQLRTKHTYIRRRSHPLNSEDKSADKKWRARTSSPRTPIQRGAATHPGSGPRHPRPLTDARMTDGRTDSTTDNGRVE